MTTHHKHLSLLCDGGAEDGTGAEEEHTEEEACPSGHQGQDDRDQQAREHQGQDDAAAHFLSRESRQKKCRQRLQLESVTEGLPVSPCYPKKGESWLPAASCIAPHGILPDRIVSYHLGRERLVTPPSSHIVRPRGATDCGPGGRIFSDPGHLRRFRLTGHCGHCVRHYLPCGTASASP